ncbi:MAG: ParB/RepB/Spo0J family partition protein [Candidatus Promineifilaceae bacterium]
MSKRRGLGRGLSSLIPPGEPENQDQGGMLTVPVTSISPNPLQPRTEMNDESLSELSSSIREHGLIQPLIVRKDDQGGYTLIAGERRWRAAQMAGLKELPVVVKEASSQEMLELALIENIQRADLNPIEEARAYQQLIDDFDLTQEDVASRVGKSRSTIANTLRLLNLPANIQAAVMAGKISGAHARALLPLETDESRTAIMNSIIKRELSVRQVEEIVKKINSAAKPTSKPPRSLSPEWSFLQTQFRQSLGTRVDIQKGQKGGKIVIHFYSDEDLQALYETIVDEVAL